MDAYSKNGNSPEDQSGRSRFRPSVWHRQDTELSACQITHSKNRKDVNVYIKGSLMYSSWQRGGQALGETFGYDKFVRDLLELEVGLEGLHLTISRRKHYSPVYAP